jgi:hypothetical protein
MEEIQSAANAGSLYDTAPSAKQNSPPTARTVYEVDGRRPSSPTAAAALAAARDGNRTVNGVTTVPSFSQSPPTKARVDSSKATPCFGEPPSYGSTANRRSGAANGRGFESAELANNGDFDDVKRRRNDEVVDALLRSLDALNDSIVPAY